MATVSTYFADFLSEIRPTSHQKGDMATGHKTLRERLESDEKLAPILENTFIQGSYARHTAIKPAGGKRSDVDVVVVTKLHESEYTPSQARELFVPFLEKWYPRKYTPQGRSFAIELSYVDLDLVITSAPTIAAVGLYKSAALAEAAFTEDDWNEEEDDRIVTTLAKSAGLQRLDEAALSAWKPNALRIPDIDSKNWEDTHPVEQLTWTKRKNKTTAGRYVNVVKALKWWRRAKVLNVERPKGYPVEAIVGANCPDDVQSLAEGVTRTLESISTRYAADAAAKRTPFLQDHGGVNRNVLHRIKGEDFAAFHAHVVTAAKLARRALDEADIAASVTLWRELFGDSFPSPPEGGKKGGFTPSSGPSKVGGGRYA